jgi:hypothetical protein
VAIVTVDRSDPELAAVTGADCKSLEFQIKFSCRDFADSNRGVDVAGKRIFAKAPARCPFANGRSTMAVKRLSQRQILCAILEGNPWQSQEKTGSAEKSAQAKKLRMACL